jgi:hypothetical protein
MVKVRLAAVFPQISNRAQRSYLEAKLREIENAQTSRRELESIGNEIDAWNDREFPLSRGYHRK